MVSSKSVLMASGYAGIDVGGTHLRILVKDAKGFKRHQVKVRVPENPVLFVNNLFKRWGLKPQALVIASRGVWTAQEKKFLQRRWRSLGRKVCVTSDVEMAHQGAFDGGPGILVSSGTGSIVFGRDPCGHQARSGGLGPLLGDEGSGFWIGRAYLKRSNWPERRLRALSKSSNPVAAVTLMARKVLMRALARDRVCQEILADAQAYLAAKVKAVAVCLHFSGGIPVSWTGGLMEVPFFRQGLKKALGRSPFFFVEPLKEPVTAACEKAQHR